MRSTGTANLSLALESRAPQKPQWFKANRPFDLLEFCIGCVNLTPRDWKEGRCSLLGLLLGLFLGPKRGLVVEVPRGDPLFPEGQ